ncbi:hypothetical protein GOODEAATRI_009603 [Goodea atripinnis]|uniref:BPTI/Kunitz inhibitor domain-containing protein n=1 Tax=Goodea atripinnis TaxID=208336 RepID=A0ABV0N1G2_9TELE
MKGFRLSPQARHKRSHPDKYSERPSQLLPSPPLQPVLLWLLPRRTHHSQGPTGSGVPTVSNSSSRPVILHPDKLAPLPSENAVECRTTTYGCCYDRKTPAGGPNGEGCPNPPNHSKTFVFTVERSICSLPRAAGSCSSWTARYHFDVITSKCVHFWYGGCHGNSNNFLTRAECQKACQVPAPSQQHPQPVVPVGESTFTGESSPERTTPGGALSPSAGSTDVQSRNMGGTFTVQDGTPSHSARHGTSAARHAHRARVYLRARRPSSAALAQLPGPAAR